MVKTLLKINSCVTPYVTQASNSFENVMVGPSLDGRPAKEGKRKQRILQHRVS